MKTTLSLSSILVVVSLALGGCAADGTDEPNDDGEDVVSVDVSENITPNRLGATGYQPRVKIADLKAAGARCVGTHCVLNGQSWDCSGGGYCSNVSR